MNWKEGMYRISSIHLHLSTSIYPPPSIPMHCNNIHHFLNPSLPHSTFDLDLNDTKSESTNNLFCIQCRPTHPYPASSSASLQCHPPFTPTWCVLHHSNNLSLFVLSSIPILSLSIPSFFFSFFFWFCSW